MIFKHIGPIGLYDFLANFFIPKEVIFIILSFPYTYAFKSKSKFELKHAAGMPGLEQERPGHAQAEPESDCCPQWSAFMSKLEMDGHFLALTSSC